MERVVRARRVQGFFRATVMVSYRQRCAISGLAVPELLNASHIIPWSANVERRADPHNGIALNVLYDRAFDRGLIAFDDACRVLISARLRSTINDDGELQALSPANDSIDLKRLTHGLLAIEGRPLDLPDRFRPDPDALAWHRREVFQA